MPPLPILSVLKAYTLRYRIVTILPTTTIIGKAAVGVFKAAFTAAGVRQYLVAASRTALVIVSARSIDAKGAYNTFKLT